MTPEPKRGLGRARKAPPTERFITTSTRLTHAERACFDAYCQRTQQSIYAVLRRALFEAGILSPAASPAGTPGEA